MSRRTRDLREKDLRVDIIKSKACTVCNCKADELACYYKNPGRVIGLYGVYTEFYDVYINDDLSRLLLSIPRINPNQIKFTTIFFPDKKKNQYSNFELDVVDTFIPEMITDANYAFAGRNTMYFINNDNENPKNSLIHLVVDDNINLVKPDGTNVNTKYNGFTHTFKPVFPSCCSTYIDFMPYVREQITKWYYGKVQILSPDTQYEVFLKNLDMLITQVQVFPKNIRVGVHVKYDNVSISSPVVIQELSSFYIMRLPETEMIGRMADTRVGYFTVGSDIITKFRLPEDGYFIKVYMDPSIPLKYKTELSSGIEKYNDLFNQVIGKRPLKFISYDDAIEFPDDYDQHDLRYCRINSSQNINTGYTGLASTIIDGRSGEILWFQIMIQTESIFSFSRVTLNYSGLKMTLNSLVSNNFKEMLNKRQQELKKITKKPCCMLFDKVKLNVDSDNYKLYLTFVVMHEFGHCIGLRHNFAGSLTANSTTSGSIMDYPPIFGENDSMITDYTAITTLGDYDLYALKYGYTILLDEITGKKHPSLAILALGYNLTDTVDPKTPLNPLYLTDEDMEIDPRCSVYDSGEQFTWADTEYTNYASVRDTILLQVQNGNITPQQYTQLWLYYYTRLLRGSVDIMMKFFGAYFYDENKITLTTSNRFQCVAAMMNLMKYIGQYRDSVFTTSDPLLADNISNYFIRPNKDELPYLVMPNGSGPLPITILQTNIAYYIFSNLFSQDRINRICMTEQQGEIRGEQYNVLDYVTKANYMSLQEYISILAFSPGVTLGDVTEFPLVPIGTPYLYIPYASFFRTFFTNSYVIPFSGLYDEDTFIDLPYPISGAPNSKIPLPYPITSPGLFPEVILATIPVYNTSLLLGIYIKDSYIEPLVVNIPQAAMIKRIAFLEVLNSISQENNQVATFVYSIVDTIVNAYSTTANRSVINKAQDLGATIADLSHLNQILKLASSIRSSITQQYSLDSSTMSNILSGNKILFSNKTPMKLFTRDIMNKLKKTTKK